MGKDLVRGLRIAGALTEVPEVPTVNGVPLVRLRIQLTCQPPTSLAAKPLMAYFLPWPNGRSIVAVELQVVRAVETGDGSVPLQHRKPVPGQAAVGIVARSRSRARSVYDMPSSDPPKRRVTLVSRPL